MSVFLKLSPWQGGLRARQSRLPERLGDFAMRRFARQADVVKQVIVELCERMPLLASFDPKGNGSKDAADPTLHLFGTGRCAAWQRPDACCLIKSLCHVRLYE